MKKPAKVIMYSTPTCPYCKRAQAYFANLGIEIIEHNVARDLEQRSVMVQASGQLGVPVIDIDGQIIVGFNRDALDKALEISEDTKA